MSTVVSAVGSLGAGVVLVGQSAGDDGGADKDDGANEDGADGPGSLFQVAMEDH